MIAIQNHIIAGGDCSVSVYLLLLFIHKLWNSIVAIMQYLIIAPIDIY